MNPAEAAITQTGKEGFESKPDEKSLKLGDRFVALILDQREHLNNGGIKLMLPSNFDLAIVLGVIGSTGIGFRVEDSKCKGIKQLVVTKIPEEKKN
jgi:hypothetical protein